MPYVYAALSYIASALYSYAAYVVAIVAAGVYERDRARSQARDAYNKSLQDRIFQVRSGVAPRQYVVGTVRVSGALMFVETIGTKKEALDVVVAVANNECELAGWYFNDDFVTLAGFPGVKYGALTDLDSRQQEFSVTGPTTSVVISSAPITTHNPVRVTWRQGGSTGTATVSSIVGATVNISALPVGVSTITVTFTTGQSLALHAQFMSGTESQGPSTWAPDYSSPHWTANHRLRGVAHARCLFVWEENIYQQGAPNVGVLATGRAMASHPYYDPRTSTNLVTTSNPAIIAGWWMTLPRVKGGCGIPSSWIDWQSISAAANICDEFVTYKSGSGYFTGPRYECNAVLSTDDPPLKNLDVILSAMAGRRAFTAGFYKIIAGAFRPATLVITDADVCGYEPINLSMASTDKSPPNICTATFADSAQNWLESSPRPVRNQAYIDADGHEETLDIVLPATTVGGRANYLMGVALEGSRPAMTLSLCVGGIGENLAIYDTAQFNLVNRPSYAGRTFELVEIEDRWDGSFETVWAEIRPQTWALDPDTFTPIDPVTLPDTSYLWNPPAPANFAVAAITPQTLPDGTAVLKIDLTWDAIANDGNTPSARIEFRFRLAGGDWVGLASVPGDATSTTISAALVDGEVYQFQARFINGVGAASAWVDAWSQIEGTPLPAPLSLRLRASSTIFRVPQSGNALPVSITLDAVKTDGLNAAAVFTTNPTVTLTGTGDSRTLAFAAMGANDSVQVTCTVTQGGIDYVDVVTILKVFDGQDADSTPDTTPPPTPTGLATQSFLVHLLISWDAPVYTQGHGHDATIVYAAPAPVGSPLPTFASAVAVGSSTGNAYQFAAEPGARWAVWIKWQSRDGYRSVSPAGGTNGLLGTTAQIGNTNLGPLVVEAGNLANGAVTTAKIAAQALDATKFASSIQPVTIVSAVPLALVTRTVFNTADGQLYRWTGTTYVRTVAAADVTGQLTDSQIAAIGAAKLTGQIAGTQITDGAISTAKLATGSVTAGQIAADTITAAQIAVGAITATELAVGAVTANAVAANAITAGKIAAGAVSATEIAAGAITASKIAVTGQGAALNDDPAGVDATAWNVVTGSAQFNVASSAAPGGSVIRLTNTGRVTSFRAFPLITGKRYRASCWARQVSGTGPFYFRLTQYNSADVEVEHSLGYEGVTLSGSFARIVGSVLTAPTAVKAAFEIVGAYQTIGVVDVADIRCEEEIPGELIVDGAITARKLTIVGGGGALNQDPDTTDKTAWTYADSRFSVVAVTDTQGITQALRSDAGAPSVQPFSRAITFDPAKQYRARARARNASGNGFFYLAVDLRDSAGGLINGDGTYWFYAANGITPPSSFTQYEGRFGAGTAKPFPSNARTMAVGAILNYTGTTGAHDVTDLLIEECVDANLIVDGAITATKLAANSIAVGTAAIQNGAIVNAMIGNAAIDSAKILELSVSKISGGTLGADISIGAGKITYDNGSFMRVQGLGFGTSSQFIDWFGPRPAGGNISLCSEANARLYIKTNGDSYWGGSLNAGTLKNAAQTTSTSPSAFVDVGPFLTNGNNKTVVLSYSYNNQITYQQGHATISGPTSAQILLQKSLNGGASWSTVTTLNVVGDTGFEHNPVPDPSFAEVSMDGSVTVTDSQGATNNLKYRGIIVSRTLPSATGTFTTNETQSVSVISNE
jgi:hypothetical protein